ncbi:MAG: Lpg1974 family pore-forming outer membrane protein [Verrucomicrobiales bacterium]|nr:Lpg1974 family pore-forming outer membrane protein [Verrucomicrobiales bacterium]
MRAAANIFFTLVTAVVAALPATTGAGEPLILNDKCPAICQQPQTGLFGSVESTFLTMNRADGVRVDDDPNENAESDYQYSPRYTLGYAIDPGRGFRIRFQGEFDELILPDQPAIAAQGNRLLAEASTLDLEYFETVSHCNYDFEFSTGLRRVNYFEAILDDQQPAFETSKAVEAWGPSIGLEAKRHIGGGSSVYAVGRHSLILGDSLVSEVNTGTITLEDSTYGITELGFGMEHSRTFGAKQVTLRGGYEWQQWQNFSYGFETTHFNDDMGAPADAGFHGFNLSVGITEAGNQSSLNEGVAVDFLEEEGSLFGSVEATFFDVNRSDGLRFLPFSFATTDDTGVEFTPRYTLGYSTSSGFGARARFWGDHQQTATNNRSVAPGAFAGRIEAEASTLDLEVFDTLCLEEYDLELSAGVRRAGYYEALSNSTFPIAGLTKEVSGWGPVVGGELRRDFAHNSLFYVRARQSLLTGDAITGHIFNGAGLPSGSRTLKDITAGITEVAFGLEHQRSLGNSTVSLRGGYEWQRWHNFSFAFEDALTPSLMGSPADAGFNGLTFSVGITGRDPGVENAPLINDFADDSGRDGLFGSVESTFFKFNRADGLRVDDDGNETTDNDFEFAPRYTLGYRMASGLGLRARFWGDFETRYLPDDPSITAEGNHLLADASTFDFEAFDTFSFCDLELELSAGLRRASYYEAIIDLTNGPGPETSKKLDGWGPILGAEVRKTIPGNNLLYAKGKHSLIVGDAVITEVGAGTRILEDTTGGITELGFGLEHNRCIGLSKLFLRAGYEWQTWHNFSYGFEDTHEDDDMGAPADGGFNGFSFSVGIER